MSIYSVLIADDECWSREVVKSLVAWDELKLSLIGEAENSAQVLKLVKDKAPDILITDMRMPEIEGDELLRQLNGICPAPKIIIMSGFEDFQYLKQAIKSQAINYLLKPIDGVELNASLKKCISEFEAASAEKIYEFRDSSFRSKYLSYRQQMADYVLQLDQGKLNASFRSFESFLINAVEEKKQQILLKRVRQDFTLILEEISSNLGLDISCILNSLREQTEPTSVSNEMITLKSCFFDVMDAIKNKNKSSSFDLIKVKAYIDRHYQEHISLDSIAQCFFVTKEYLSRVFKAGMNENLSDYILRKRMEKAKELIIERKIEIKRIAEMVGYEDNAYFYRVFRKYFGIAPGELRR